ncbi:MAG: NAD(P)H-dependent oxidoreductase subunit E [Thermoanaerobaculia bacterium]
MGRLEGLQDWEVKANDLIKAYPDRKASLLPLLHLSQEFWGCINEDVIDLISKKLKLTPSYVYGVASFYTMYHFERKGKIHIRICTNVSCQIKGAEEILKKLEEKLGIKEGGVSEDGKISIEKVECLGACDRAPVVMVNDHYEGPVDLEWVEKIVSQ